MRETLSIGSSPSAEDCVQVGSDNYGERARKECTAFMNQLRRVFGEPPTGARLSIASNPHDFGNYYEVAVVYDEAYPEAVDYAFRLEGETPEVWDEAARQELGLIPA